MYVKNTLLSLLRERGIEYTLYEHEAVAHGDIDFALPDMQGRMLKNLVLTNKSRELYIFTLPVDMRADLRGLSDALKVPRFSFASVSDLAFLGVPPGHVTPFCMLNDPGYKVHYVQPVELDCIKTVNCHPLDNHFSVDINREELEKLLSDFGHEIIKVSGAVRE